MTIYLLEMGALEKGILETGALEMAELENGYDHLMTTLQLTYNCLPSACPVYQNNFIFA
jgi:hypothetical protein